MQLLQIDQIKHATGQAIRSSCLLPPLFASSSHGGTMAVYKQLTVGALPLVERYRQDISKFVRNRDRLLQPL